LLDLTFPAFTVRLAQGESRVYGLHRYKNGLFSRLIARLKEPAAPFSCWLEEHRLVSYAHDRLSVIDRAQELWKAEDDEVKTSPALMMYCILASVVDAYSKPIDDLEEHIDGVEDRFLSQRTPDIRELVDARTTIGDLRRALVTVRSSLLHFVHPDSRFVPTFCKPYFAEIYEQLLRSMEDLDAVRDTISTLMDVLMSRSSNELNAVMKKMTYFNTVLMAMALVAGVYGMNFERMPELSWVYGYPFALFLMVVAGALVTMGFKMARWI